MLKIDMERSETGSQRRKHPRGRLLHCCCICGRLDVWDDGWSTYCSEKDLDDGTAVPKFCSERCRQAGGSSAQNVTREMKLAAREAEWREPNIVYREATEREKYAEAAWLQQDRRSRHGKRDDEEKIR